MIEPRPGDGQFHTLAEAAKILGISLKTLRTHIELGRIRSVIVGNGAVRKSRRITDKNIASFTEKQKVREIAPCQSKSPQNPRSTNTTSKSNVVDLWARLNPNSKKKQKS